MENYICYFTGVMGIMDQDGEYITFEKMLETLNKEKYVDTYDLNANIVKQKIQEIKTSKHSRYFNIIVENLPENTQYLTCKDEWKEVKELTKEDVLFEYENAHISSKYVLFKCTGNIKFLTSKLEWKEAKNLTKDDVLYGNYNIVNIFREMACVSSKVYGVIMQESNNLKVYYAKGKCNIGLFVSS